jgi:hypothetical protein
MTAISSATIFTASDAVGACGTVIQNSDLAVALSPTDFEDGARCGQVIVFERELARCYSGLERSNFKQTMARALLPWSRTPALVVTTWIA